MGTRGGSNEYLQSMFWVETWKIISEFLSENFQFLEVKFSIYLNRPVYLCNGIYSQFVSLCGLNTYSHFEAAIWLKDMFRASTTSLRTQQLFFYLPFQGGSSVAVRLCSCDGGFISGFCFILTYSSFLNLLVSRQACASWYWHLPDILFIVRFRLIHHENMSI